MLRPICDGVTLRNHSRPRILAAQQDYFRPSYYSTGVDCEFTENGGAKHFCCM